MSYPKRTLLAAALAVPLVLAACGGGGSSGGLTGNANGGTDLVPSAQVASGVVTGFGSVYLDGERLDDANVGAVAEQADGTERPAVLQLGQRVRATHDGEGKATRLVVDASVIGKVTAVPAMGGVLRIAGQNVLVNEDPTLGPVTQFGGDNADAAGRFAAVTDIQIDDLAEVHGSPAFVNGEWVVNATRIDKRSEIGPVRVVGVVANLVNTDAAKTFDIGGLTIDFAGALAAGKVRSIDRLAAGVTVQVFGGNAGVVGNRLVAQAVRVAPERLDAPVATLMQLGGVVSSMDVSAGTFNVDGALVRVGTVTPLPAGAVIGNGGWVRVEGTLAVDGSIDASKIQVRQNNVASDLARVRLVGPISGLVDQNTFIVRDVPVDATAVDAASRTNCADLIDGTSVTVTAVMQAGSDVVTADSLRCEVPQADRPQPGQVGGVVASVDQASKTLVVTDRQGKSQTIRWTDATAFIGPVLKGGPTALQAAMAVQAAGQTEGAVLVAKVIAEHGARPVDRLRERPEAPPVQGQPQGQAQAPAPAVTPAEVLANWLSSRRPPPRR